MGRALGQDWRSGLGAALGLCVAAALLIAPAEAQTAKKSGKAQPAAAAQDGGDDEAGQLAGAYDAGIKAWQAGKADIATKQLSTAISGGKLPPQQMAKALYVRGLAQRKLGKPALAISDLTSAMWMKGGLSDSERNEAQAARSAAYREAGIAEPPAAGGARPAVAPTVSASAPAQAAPATGVRPSSPAAPAAPVTTTQSTGDGAAWKTRVQATGSKPAPTMPAAAPAVATVPAPIPAAAVAAKPAVAAPIPAPPASVAPRVATASPVAVAAAPAVAAPAAPAPEPTASKGFFSSLFSDMSLGGSLPPAPQMPERRVPPAPHLADDPDAQKQQAQLDGWSNAKVRQQPAGARVAAAAPAAPATTGSTAVVAPEGRYRLQVGAARSKSEAEKIAAQLKREQGKAVAQRAVEIDQVGGDNLQAAVWRVRVGPYASANEPRNLCVKLRQSGYDCMVVTQ